MQQFSVLNYPGVVWRDVAKMETLIIFVETSLRNLKTYTFSVLWLNFALTMRNPLKEAFENVVISNFLRFHIIFKNLVVIYLFVPDCL